MTTENKAIVLEMLKVDLGISTDAYDNRLNQYIDMAVENILREGIKLEETVEDNSLVAIYSAWMWRKRDTGEGMPRMIRYNLNNKLFSQRLKGDEADG